MKKSVLFLMILGIFVACDNNGAINNKIDPNECYMLQEFNELGEPVESYRCIVFEKNAGCTYEDAFNSIKSDLKTIFIVSELKITDEEIEDKPHYTDDDYFLKSPRIRKYIETNIKKR